MKPDCAHPLPFDPGRAVDCDLEDLRPSNLRPVAAMTADPRCGLPPLVLAQRPEMTGADSMLAKWRVRRGTRCSGLPAPTQSSWPTTTCDGAQASKTNGPGAH